MLITGLSRIDITPEESVPLIGYGDRTHGSVVVHDPLSAYAWYLKNNAGNEFVWIILDVCLFSVKTASDLKKMIAARTGLSSDDILLQATHTHSGPDTSMLTDTEEAWAQRYAKLLGERLSSAASEAKRNSFEGTIEVRKGSLSIGTNRRGTELPIDRGLIVLSLRDRQGLVRGVLFHHSCHLTSLGVDNYLISADWVGSVRSRFEKDRKIPFAFLQGAEGNIDPRTRGVLDMADPDQAKGISFSEMEKLSDEAASALDAALASPLIESLDDFRILPVQTQLPLKFGPLPDTAVREKIETWKSSFGKFLGIDAASVPEAGIINALVKERCRELALSASEVRHWVAEQFAYTSFFMIYLRAGENVDVKRGFAEVPVTVVDFGKLFFACTPAEVLIENAFDLRERFKTKIALIAGLANGWMGYFPHSSNYKEKAAGELYETVSTLFSEKASGIFLGAVEKAVRG